METSQESEAIRTAMHDAIDEKDFSKVERHLKEMKHLRKWLNPETGESALYHTLRKRAFKIHAHLLANGCVLNEKSQDVADILNELSRMEESERQYQLRSFLGKSRHVSYLMLRSSSKTRHEGFEAETKKLYEKLDEIPIISSILKVVASSWHLQVIFDFDSEHIDAMLGHKYGKMSGVVLHDFQVYISGKKSFQDLLGTTAQQFASLALQLVYQNGGKPYEVADIMNKCRYQYIISEIKQSICEGVIVLDEIEDVLFETYEDKDKVEQELIARVPYILAKHTEMKGSYEGGAVNVSTGEKLLKEQAPGLLRFFSDVVIPDMEGYVEQSVLQRDKYEIEQLNSRLLTATKLQRLGINFHWKCDLVDKPLHVLSSPSLTLYEAMTEELVRSTGLSYLFLQTSQWNRKVEETLEQYKCHFIVLSNKGGSCEKLTKTTDERSDKIEVEVVSFGKVGHQTSSAYERCTEITIEEGEQSKLSEITCETVTDIGPFVWMVKSEVPPSVAVGGKWGPLFPPQLFVKKLTWDNAKSLMEKAASFLSAQSRFRSTRRDRPGNLPGLPSTVHTRRDEEEFTESTDEGDEQKESTEITFKEIVDIEPAVRIQEWNLPRYPSTVHTRRDEEAFTESTDEGDEQKKSTEITFKEIVDIEPAVRIQEWNLPGYPSTVHTGRGKEKLTESTRKLGDKDKFTESMKNLAKSAFKEGSHNDPTEGDYTSISAFLSELTKVKETQVIVLTEDAEEDQLVKYLRKQESFAPNESVHTDTFQDSGYDLVTESCKMQKLLSSHIYLQGSKFKRKVAEIWEEEDAKKILGALDETTFLKLCQEMKLEVGPELPRLDENVLSCYIERTFKISTEVHLHEALSDRNKAEAFAIVGCSKGCLRHIVPSNFYVCEYKDVKKFEKCFLLNNESDYDGIAQSNHYRHRTIHLLRYEAQKQSVHWIKSNGPLSHLPKLTANIQRFTSTKSLIHARPDKILAICGEPGIGKTVISLRVAHDIKTVKEMTWVVHINARTIFEQVDVTRIEDLDVTVILAKLCGVDEGTFEFSLLVRSVTSGRPFEVVVLFDAFDALNTFDAADRNFVLNLITCLKKTGTSKVLLFSRNCLKSEIQDEFRTMSFELDHLDKEEEKLLLKQLCKRNGFEADDAFLGGLSVQKTITAGNPGFVRILAKILKHITRSGKQGFVQRCHSILLEIHKMFVDLGINEYMTNIFGPLNMSSTAIQAQLSVETSACYLNHGLFAVNTLLDRGLLEQLLTKTGLKLLMAQVSEKAYISSLHGGFIDGCDRGIPVFVRRTFAEFFAAHFLAQAVTAENVNHNVLPSIAGMYKHQHYKGLLNFFDAVGAKSCAFHCNILDNTWQSADKVIWDCGRQDAFGRTPLHIAALHTDDEKLHTLVILLGERITEELSLQDIFGMTPLRYAQYVPGRQHACSVLGALTRT